MSVAKFRDLLAANFLPEYLVNAYTFNIMKTSSGLLTSRRDFLKTSALAGGILAAPGIFPGGLFSKENSDTLRVGLICCGGRGSRPAGPTLCAGKKGGPTP